MRNMFIKTAAEKRAFVRRLIGMRKHAQDDWVTINNGTGNVKFTNVVSPHVPSIPPYTRSMVTPGMQKFVDDVHTRQTNAMNEYGRNEQQRLQHDIELNKKNWGTHYEYRDTPTVRTYKKEEIPTDALAGNPVLHPSNFKSRQDYKNYLIKMVGANKKYGAEDNVRATQGFGISGALIDGLNWLYDKFNPISPPQVMNEHGEMIDKPGWHPSYQEPHGKINTHINENSFNRN